MSRSYSPGRRPNSKSRERQEKMLDLLEDHGPITEIQLGEMLHVSANIVNQMVWLAHEQHRAHIAGQTLSKIRRNYEVNLWGAGCKPDVLSPLMQRRLHNRLKGIELAGSRKIVSEIKPFRDPMVWALFGGATA
jgi:hypothetical protein